MPTLLDISEDLIALDRLLEETGGEITPDTEVAIDQWFAELGDARDAKLDGYAALISEFTLLAAAREREQNRLALLVRADENKAKALKERLKMFMEIQKLKKIETRRYRLSICGNGGIQPLEITIDVEKLSGRYQKAVITADQEALRHDLEAGVKVDGARLLPRGNHLRIA